MDLLTLRLRAPIDYLGSDAVPMDAVRKDTGPKDAASEGAIIPAPLREDGYEDLTLFANAIVESEDDGPLVVSPLPSPSFFGQSLERREPTSAGERFRLEAASYCFVQVRGPYAGLDASGAFVDGEGLRALFEEFVRDAWWENDLCEGPLMLRRVYEDGKFALQLIRKLSDAKPGTDAS